MSINPLASQPAGELSTAPSLEELLSVRPQEHAAHPANDGHVQPPLHPAKPPVMASTPSARVNLLLISTRGPANALLQAWMERVLDGQRPHVTHDLDQAADQVRLLQPQAILIEFDPDALDNAGALATQLQALYPGIPRMAVSRALYPQCMLAALRAGVQDFLDIDGPIDASQQIVRDLLARPLQLPQTQAQPAPQTAIVSARAGLGCSVLAAHLAWYLQQRLAPQPAPAANTADDESLASLLIELGSPGGDCAIYLNMPGEFSFADAVHQQRRLDRRMAQSALARHESGLRLLPQPRHTQPPASGDVHALLMRLGQYFSHIVLDLGADTPQPLMADLLPSASEIWVLCDQNVVSVVWTMELLRQIDALGIARERLRLIVNRHDSRLALDAQQIARQLQLPLLATLPERRRELADAVNHGKLLAPRQKRDPYVQAIEKLVAVLLADHHPTAAQHTISSSGPLSGLLQRIRKH
ncbi:MAG: AAA family ATPase [Comamonas sp.]